MNIIPYHFIKRFNMCIFMACMALLKGGSSKYKVPKEEYKVSTKDSNRNIEQDITCDFYVSSLPLSIIV